MAHLILCNASSLQRNASAVHCSKQNMKSSYKYFWVKFHCQSSYTGARICLWIRLKNTGNYRIYNQELLKIFVFLSLAVNPFFTKDTILTPSSLRIPYGITHLGICLWLAIPFIMHFSSQCVNPEKVTPLWGWLLG